MTAMYQIICVGPGPLDQPRRVIDRGPLLGDEARVNRVADWLRATGIYESVTVVRSGGVQESKIADEAQ